MPWSPATPLLPHLPKLFSQQSRSSWSSWAQGQCNSSLNHSLKTCTKTLAKSCHKSKMSKESSLKAIEMKQCKSSTENSNQWLLCIFYKSKSIWKALENELTAIKRGLCQTPTRTMSFSKIIQSQVWSQLRIQITAWHFRPSPSVTDQQDRAQTFCLPNIIILVPTEKLY